MKDSSLIKSLVMIEPVKSLSGRQFWLLSIIAGLVTIHLTLTSYLESPSFFMLSLLEWIAAAALIWQRRDQLTLNSTPVASLAGLLLIAIVLYRSASFATTNLLYIFPFTVGLGVTLLASGFAGVKNYRRELTLLFFVGVPKILLESIGFFVSNITARVAALFLWYGGASVSLKGSTIFLPHGAVHVTIGCSGFNGMFYLLGFGVMTVIMYPISGKKRFFIPLIAMLFAFITNSFRIVLMALFANAQNQQALEYWHNGKGALLFPLIAVTLFGLFYFFLLRRDVAAYPDSMES